MMKNIWIGVGIVVAIGMVFLLSYMYSTRGLMLVAKGAVPVYETETDAMKSPSPAVLTELSAGQSVSVVKCVDVKHYIIYKVRLPDGRDGFILDGEYALTRDGEEAHCS